MPHSPTTVHPMTSPGGTCSSDWPDWMEDVEDALLDGRPVTETTRTELARRGVRIADLLDMTESGKVRQLYELGWTAPDIAIALGLEDDVVEDAVSRIDPDTHRVLDGHAAGQTAQQIHKDTGFSRAWVYKVLQRRGLTPNVQLGRAKELTARKRAEVLRRWRSGDPATAIARTTGATVHQVNYIARTEGRRS